jgi:7-keto-8-aminopelargonate synthetase-like enzyme
MSSSEQVHQMVDDAISEAARHGVVFLQAQEETLDGRRVWIDGQPRINFASCSYLGLELDPRLKAGAIEAIERYGTQFSSSRTYVSGPLYDELETQLDEIFDGYAMVTPNTTLGHAAALPVLIGSNDAVLLDHQVHHSVQLVIPQLRAQGASVEIVRHGEIEALDARIRELSASHDRIWYLADGVYSMYGDFAPARALTWLMEVHEKLHLYIDDAHGMSWYGRHGRGFARESLPWNERVVLAISLNKAFGAGGGAVVFFDEESRRRVRTCGGPMIFTGPLQPPMLGAAVASARLHLSGEIETMQRELRERIEFTNRTCRELDLPLVSDSPVPIRFIGLGLPPSIHDMSAHMLEQGFLANCATFPAVSARCSGLRFTVTRHQTEGDIRAFLETVAARLPESLARSEATRADVDRAFGLQRRSKWRSPSTGASGLRVQHETSIEALDAEEWDRLLGGRGAFDAAALRFLEQAFGEDQKPENRWRFHYYLVRDPSDRPVLATFFTEALWKDDLAADGEVSLDRSADWRGALTLLQMRVESDREAADATLVAFQDCSAEAGPFDEHMRAAGFVPTSLPDSFSVDARFEDWNDHLATLSTRARRFQRKQVEPFDEAWELSVLDCRSPRPPAAVMAHFNRLYREVQERSLALNTFPLPDDFFERMLGYPGFELLTLKLRTEAGGAVDALPQVFGACFAGRTQYVPLVAGLDYRVVSTHAGYRQLLKHALLRARARGLERVFFGMGADLEKSRMGALPTEHRLYVQSHDHFQQDVMAMISTAPTHVAAPPA